MKTVDYAKCLKQLMNDYRTYATNEEMSFYDHEDGFLKEWMELGRQVYEDTLGACPNDHRKKKRLKRNWEKLT